MIEEISENDELWQNSLMKYDLIFGFKILNKTVGVIGLTRYSENLIASRFFVLPEHRQQGIGSEILEHCKATSARLGCRLLLYVDKNEPETARLCRFYEKRGFREADLAQAQGWHVTLDEEFDHLFFLA